MNLMTKRILSVVALSAGLIILSLPEAQADDRRDRSSRSRGDDGSRASRDRGSRSSGSVTSGNRNSRSDRYNRSSSRSSRGDRYSRSGSSSSSRGDRYNRGGSSSSSRGDRYNRDGNSNHNRGNRYGSGGTNHNNRYNRGNHYNRSNHGRYGSGGYRPRTDDHRGSRGRFRYRQAPQHRVDYHRRYYHRPNWHRPGVRYISYQHSPYRSHINSHRHWGHKRYYHRTIPFKFIYWNRWLRRKIAYSNGYRWYNNYPYFVYNGYLHRYSPVDYCDYDLVDGHTNRVVDNFDYMTCRQAYDRCAYERDRRNDWENNYRYFCAEEFLYEDNYDYGWNYNDDFYSDIY